MDKLQTKFPYEIRDVNVETNAELMQYYTGERTGFVQVGPEGYFMPYKYKEEAELYYNFEARPDDIWIVTLPRSGTTWTQEMIWLLANDLDFEQAQRRLLVERFPFFEHSIFIHDAVKKEFLNSNKDCEANQECIEKICSSNLEILNVIPRNQRRFIKTHLPLSLLPPSVMENNCKIIYVARNPKDVAVSYFHFHRLFRNLGYNGDFERFWRYFELGLNYWLPYNSHVKEAKQLTHLSNVLFLNYEDTLKDLKRAVNKVGDFLDCKPSAAGLEKLLDHLSIQNFRQNKSVNMNQMRGLGIMNENEAGFVRKGADSTHGKKNDLQEFVDHPDILQNANKWVQQYNTIFKSF